MVRRRKEEGKVIGQHGAFVVVAMDCGGPFSYDSSFFSSI